MAGLKCWLLEFREFRASYGWTQKQFRICPYCGNDRALDNLGVRLTDKYCPTCGKEIKLNEN